MGEFLEVTTLQGGLKRQFCFGTFLTQALAVI